MSKELLDNVYTIKNAITYLKGNSYIKEDSYSMEALYHIEKALTPPTAEEVCKALIDYFKKSKYHGYIDTAYYSEEGKYFYTEDENRSLVALMFDNYYIHEIPPHLITLIGRFYEGVKGEIK